MLKQLTDKNSVQQCKVTITESRKRMDFLVGELRKLGIPAPPLSEADSTSEVLRDTLNTSSIVAPGELIKRNSEPGFHRHASLGARFQQSRSVAQLNAIQKPAISSVFSSILSSFGLKHENNSSPQTNSSLSSQPLPAKTHTILLGSFFLRIHRPLTNHNNRLLAK